MNDQKNTNYICNSCGNPVSKTFEFCPDCGNILLENIKCDIHEDRSAVGVCVICSVPFCPDCGVRINNHFLCEVHKKYEIYESMARVFGGSDFANINYLKDCLEKEDLHPILFSRNQNPFSFGGPEVPFFGSLKEDKDLVINEVKLMVPFQEVLKAEEVLRKIEV